MFVEEKRETSAIPKGKDIKTDEHSKPNENTHKKEQHTKPNKRVKRKICT